MSDPTPQPYAELGTFGEELRREREIRGISLKEISDATKISKRFLEAIERNDHRTLPAPVFTRGFVREYARYLGLNSEDIVNRYNYAAAGDDRIEKSIHLERLAQREPPPKKGIPPPYARVDRNVVVLLIIVAVLGAATYIAVWHKRALLQAARIETAISPAVRRAGTASGTQKTAGGTPAATTTTAGETPAATPMKMVINVSEDSWVILDADGKEVINERLRQGDSRTVEANDSFDFRTIGNAAGLDVTLNDTKLPPLGTEGEVIHDRVFDRSSLKNP